MQFKQVDRSELPVTQTRDSKSTRLIQEFLDSGFDLVQVELEDSDKKVESVRSTLGNYIKRHNIDAKVFTRGGNLYLEKGAAGVDNGQVPE